MRPSPIPALLLAVAIPCPGHAQSKLEVKGYITRVASPSDFEIDGRRVVLTGETQIAFDNPSPPKHITPPRNPYLGEPAQASGSCDSATRTCTALTLTLNPRIPWVITGIGIIDAVPALPPGASPATDRIFRADGYRILITPKTRMSFKKPLQSLSDIGANVWIEYRGTRGLDGVITADLVQFRKNVISPGELNLREKWEYDPTTPLAPGDRQSRLDKLVRGVDPSRFPPYKDAAMQARIAAVGSRLIPHYQADLPPSDPTRINFRFYLVDAPKWHTAVPLPNGIILVPYPLVQRLTADSDLAVILADSVAWLLEEQPPPLPRTATDLATDAPMLDPYLAAAALATRKTASDPTVLLEDQRDRVSISLLHDAGYDIAQAPLTWWLLRAKDSAGLADTPLPSRAAYLYQFLGDTWPEP